MLANLPRHFFRRLFPAFLCLAVVSSNALAQVNGPGRSDPNDFDTVITTIGFLDGGPGETDLSVPTSVGNTNGNTTSTTQLNVNIFNDFPSAFLDVFAGAELNLNNGSGIAVVEVFDGAEANIFGEVVNGLTANSGSFVSIFDGAFLEGSFQNGVTTPSFLARSGSVVNVNGGSIGASSRSETGSVVNITGGGIDLIFQAGGEVNISGGELSGLNPQSGSVVNITGGEIDTVGSFESGSTVNISGGILTSQRSLDPAPIFADSVVNVSGGVLESAFTLLTGGELNLLGTEFLLNDVPLESLSGTPTVISDRSQTLSGILLDGSSFAFDLSVTSDGPIDPVTFQAIPFFDPGGTITVSIVPEPTSFILLCLGSIGLLRRRRSH